MRPDTLARQAIRVTTRVEDDVSRIVMRYLDVVERDAIRSLASLDLRDRTARRAVLELRARTVVQQSNAARQLLSMSDAQGPLAGEFRAGIEQSYTEGIERAADAVLRGEFFDADEVRRLVQFGPRVDLELLESIAGTTLTSLEDVGEDGLRRIEDAIVRGSVRGIGPRKTARMVRDAIDMTKSDSERITRTVFMRANNDARDQTFRDMHVRHLQHNATNDDRTCEYCEARHGMVYRVSDAPDPPLHPHCRCVLLPWREDMLARGDDYYQESRREMRERREREGRRGSSAAARAPFERSDGRDAPTPVWAPGRGWL